MVEETLFLPGEIVEYSGRPAWGQGKIVRMFDFDEGTYVVRWLREDKEREVENVVSGANLFLAP